MTKRYGSLAASLGAAALLLTAAGAYAQDASPTAPAMSPAPAMSGMASNPSSTVSPMDQVFMLRAAQGDMAEISTSQMALKKASDPGVKQVAQRLVTDHSQSLNEGTGLATLLGLTPPKGPGVTNMAVAKQLMSAKGKDFDKQYMAAQVEAHENVIALYHLELNQGQNPQVKAFAAKYLPGIEGHTAQIYQVAQSVGAPDSQLRPSMPPSDSTMSTMSMPTPATDTTPGSTGTSPADNSPTSTPAPPTPPGSLGQ